MSQYNNFEEELRDLKLQEEEIQFKCFSSGMALDIGLMLYEEAKMIEKTIVIDISRNGQCLFHYAMESTSIDNEKWINKKNNVVNRFGQSSYQVGTRLRSQGLTIEEKYGIPSSEFAPHGGAFPLLIKGVGPVGTITISGLPQKEDHDLVVKVLRSYLFKQLKS
jgi:uncharacterized protein (UPF0303 family)